MDLGNDVYLNMTEEKETMGTRTPVPAEIIRGASLRELASYIYDHMGMILFSSNILNEYLLDNGTDTRSIVLESLKKGYIGVDFDRYVIGIKAGTVFSDVPMLMDIRDIYTEVCEKYGCRVKEIPTFTVIYFDHDGSPVRAARL